MSTPAPTLGEAVWTVPTGLAFTTTLVVQPGQTDAGYPTFGARIEAPVTRAIVSAFQPATLNGRVWTVLLEAPLDDGAYELVWMTVDAPPTFEAFVPIVASHEATYGMALVEFPPVDESQVTPTPNDVAMLEAVRTVDANGQEQDSFNDTTRPTSTEVLDLITAATDYTLSQMRTNLDPVHYPQVKHLICLYTAMLIEGSYYREQPTQRADLWYTLWTQALTNLNARIEQDIQQALTPVWGMEPWKPPHRLEQWQML